MDPEEQYKVLCAQDRLFAIQIANLCKQMLSIEDRVGVIETNTIDHENRLQDLEAKEDDDYVVG
jgi:hypothetical protein